METEDVYEEYRSRLLNSKADILRIEIFETFAGTDFIDNTLDLVDILLGKDYELIVEELNRIMENIKQIKSSKYTQNETKGYYLIAKGYLLRIKEREDI